jgi:predicted membrane GTPase involved in stress response
VPDFSRSFEGAV